jgi:hypothetical protein
VNTRWPNRSKISDGTIGDAAHASRNSDHNPWVKDSHGVGVVRAFDCTAIGIDPTAYAEHIRALGKAGDPRLVGGGYVIWYLHIASEKGNWAWRKYTGPNGHTHHIHVSVSRNPAGYDSTASWGIENIGRAPDINAGREWHGFSDKVTDASIYAAGYRMYEVSEVEMLLMKLGFLPQGLPTGRYEGAVSDAIVAFKKKASWKDDKGRPERSRAVTSEVIKALRLLAAAA